MRDKTRAGNLTLELALEPRRMRMITEVGAERNTMTIIMTPGEFVDMARAIAQGGGRVEASRPAT